MSHVQHGQYRQNACYPEQIALVEPFEPSPENPLRSWREFRSRIVLLNRDSVLAETETSVFAEQNGFRVLEADSVATNPAVQGFRAIGGFSAVEAISIANCLARFGR
jgi:hypothetical protein